MPHTPLARQHLTDMFRHAPMVLAELTGPDFVVEIVNNRAAELWGHSDPAGIVGKKLFDEVVPAAKGQGFEQLLRSVLTTGQAHVARELPAILPSGPEQALEQHWFDFAYEPVRDAQGAITGVMCIGTEVTATVRQRHAEVERASRRVQIAEDRLRLLTSTGEIATWSIDFENGLVHGDDWLFELHGLKAPGPHPVTALTDRIEAADREHVLATYGALVNDPAGGRLEVDYRVRSLDGKLRWLASTGTLDTKSEGPKTFVGLVRDMTERKNSELEIGRGRERLHEQFMQAPVAISVVSGPQHVVELANPKYCEMVGRTGLIGKTFRQAFPELAPDAPVFQMLDGVWRSGTAFVAEDYVVPIKRSGVIEDVHFKFVCQPVRNATGEVTDIVTVAIDVSASARERERSNALLEALKSADQRKDQFLAMLAHELRNPMAAISGALDLLEQAKGDDPRAPRYRETARRQMKNLVRMVDDLLDVARINSGKIELRKDPVDLGGVVQQALAATRQAIEGRQHAVSVRVAAGALRMMADATRLEQVVVNLLTNAAKYTEPGGRIDVSLEAEGGWAVLKVKDSGRGIPLEQQHHIFELFMQVNPTLDRTAGGLGLGLTLVKRLVELHGGQVGVASEGAGKGTEFSVRLPLGKTPYVPQRIEEGEGFVPEKRRVLVVEDSEDVREMMKELLEDLGHEVFTAVNGVEGVERATSLQPDVALVDVGLPLLDGYEVARRTRAAPGGDRVKLVALTGYGGQEVTERAVNAGFDMHLTKPVDLDALVKALRP